MDTFKRDQTNDSVTYTTDRRRPWNWNRCVKSLSGHYTCKFV